MPSLWHNSEMLVYRRRSSSTMRIFSSAEYCLRVARRMSFTIRSDDNLEVPDFWLISEQAFTMLEKAPIAVAAPVEASQKLRLAFLRPAVRPERGMNGSASGARLRTRSIVSTRQQELDSKRLFD